MFEQLKAYTGKKIFDRGVRYYTQGCVHEYSLTQKGDDLYEIRGLVQGTYPYDVYLKFRVSAEKLKILDSFCECPYDWGNFCKHETAVLYKFFSEDYLKLTWGLQAHPQGAYESLKTMAVKSREGQNSDHSGALLQYEVKGLKNVNMVNFRLQINSMELKDEVIQEMITALRNSLDLSSNYDLRFRTEILNTLSGFDCLVLEHLGRIQTRLSPKNRIVFFRKTKESLDFLLTILENRLVYQENSVHPLKKGETIKPLVFIDGSLDHLEIGYDPGLTEDEGLYHPELDCVVMDDTIHLLDTSGLSTLSSGIEVPREKQGELLFEVLPQLEKRFRLSLAPAFKAHRLKVIQPEIELDLDYQDEMIVCRPRVKINNHVYENQDALQISKYEGYYEPQKSTTNSWITVNQEMIKDFFRFFDENGFTVSPEGLTIKEPEALIRFMLQGKKGIPRSWLVTPSPRFMEFKVSTIQLEPIVELNMDDTIDWFEFKIYYHLGGKTYSHQEIMKMMRASTSGEKYIKLGDELFFLGEADRIDQLDRSLRSVSSKEPGAREELYNIFFYRQLFAEQGLKVAGNRVYNQFAQDISAQKLINPYPLPDSFHGKLRSYQKEGYYWLRFLHQYRLGGILGDDMGLGKTVQVLTLISSLSLAHPCLVVAPRSLIYNWAAEIEKFYPQTKHLIYYGSPQERRSLQGLIPEQKIVITTYDTLNRDSELLQGFHFSYCILDEAQHIKNHQTRRAKMVKKIKADHRLVMTGTPIENSLAELWSLFDFLMPGYLGSQRKFGKTFVKPIKEGNNRVLTLLKQKVSPFILRRRKGEVLTELPEKIVSRSKVFMTKLQADAYQTVLADLKEKVMATVSSRGLDKSRFTVLSALTKLRQICNHPRLVLPDLGPETDSGKVETLMELIQEGIDGGHKIVVFSQFVKMLKIIEAKLGLEKITYEYLDGRTKDRMERINRFNADPQIPVFLISLKAGGVGINLTSADLVIHVDPWWNPMAENQATDRVHRIGQKKQVLVYKLITIGTVEEKILKLQAKKSSIFEAVIEQNQHPVSALTWEDLKALFD